MNRRKFFFSSVAASATILLSSQVLTSSCKKKDPAPVAGDYLDKATIAKLNAAVLGASTLAALPADIQAAAASIETIITPAEVETYSTADLSPVILMYKTNIIISADEKTRLLANDAATLSAVMNRMLKMPSFTSEVAVAGSSTAIGNNSQLSAYSMENTAAGADLYSGQYYQCALDQQSFIRDNTIAKLEKISALKSTGTKSASIVGSTSALTANEKRIVALLMVLALAELHGLIKVVALMRAKLAKLHIGG